ncbi:methionyl-tRNA formyltransferase [Streptomyces sp. TLI_185]|nr:methionyl-tRNA formyltransferase [Streptomyces sp. TLI_185]
MAALTALLQSPLVRVAAVITLPDENRHRLSGAADLPGAALAAEVPLIRESDLNTADMAARIRALDPDVMVVVGWTRLLGAELLSVPRLGCVGFHASLLPRHRGRAPVNWAILRGESVTGNTMMMLDPGVDTGDIVDQRTVLIGPDDTCGTVYDRVARAGAGMLIAHLPALLEGGAPRRPQNPAEGDVLPRRSPAMGVIDWDRPARAVHDWVRALTTPYPGAFGVMDGERVMVWHTRLPRHDEPGGPPGSVLSVQPEGVRVATRAGSVLVTVMSGPDEPPQPAAYWSRKAGLGPGARFAAVPSEIAAWALGEGPRPEGVTI